MGGQFAWLSLKRGGRLIRRLGSSPEQLQVPDSQSAQKVPRQGPGFHVSTINGCLAGRKKMIDLLVNDERKQEHTRITLIRGPYTAWRWPKTPGPKNAG